MKPLTTVPNKLGRMRTTGFDWRYNCIGYDLFFQGQAVTKYRRRALFSLSAAARRRNVELFRLIAVGIAERMYARMLKERNQNR